MKTRVYVVVYPVIIIYVYIVEKKRSDEELAELDSKSKITKDMVCVCACG